MTPDEYLPQEEETPFPQKTAQRHQRATWFAEYTGPLALLILFSASGIAQQNTSGRQEGEQSGQADKKREAPRKRIEFFNRPRAFPLGMIPGGARVRSLQQKNAMLGAELGPSSEIPGLSLPALAPFAGAWRSIGPQPTLPGTPPFASPYGNTSGRVTAIAIDPTDSSGNTVFIGAAQGGVWRTTDGGNTWTPLTDNQASLAMGALAIGIDATNALDGTRHRVVYAGTGEQSGFGLDVYYGAGVLISKDGGQTWAQTCTGSGVALNSTCPFIGPFGNNLFPGGGARISSLAINPDAAKNARQVLAGVEIFGSTTSQPGEPGIYCTDDAGANWALVLPGAIGTSVFYVSNTKAYAALGRPDAPTAVSAPANGIYVSANANAACGQQVWARVVGNGLPLQSMMGRIALAQMPGLVGGQVVLYAAVADVTTDSNSLSPGGGVYRSADGGANWIRSNAPDFCSPQCWYDMAIAVDPGDATGNTIFAGGSATKDSFGNSRTLIRSVDGGATWTTVSGSSDGTLLHVNHHAIAFNAGGSKLFAGNDGGVWSTANPLAASQSTASGIVTSITWNNLNSGLAVAQFYPGLSMHPSSNALAFGGTQGNGTQAFQGFSASSWTNTATCGDGATTIVDPNQPSTVYLNCVALPGGAKIWKSTLSGKLGSFNLLASSGTISPNDAINPLAPFVVDPNRASHLYFGTYRLYETIDGAATWTAVTGDVTLGGNQNGAALTSIAFAPLANGRFNLYAGANDGTMALAPNVTAGVAPVFASVTGHGSCFISLNVGNGLPCRSVTKVIADPSDSTGSTAWVSFSGFSIGQSIAGGPIDLKGHIFRTTNGGASWADVSCHTSDCSAPLATDLPNTPVNDILLDPGDTTNHRTLYAATDIGVFVTADGGATWRVMGTALPNVAVFSLTLHEPSRTLRAGTHGRSVWDYSLPALTGTRAFALSGLNPINAQAGSGAFTLTLTGRGFTSGSTVQWNGATLANPTVNVAAQTITVQVAANLVSQGGTAALSVVDTSQSPNTTNILSFTIAGNAPTLVSVVPSSVNAGAADTQVTINGTGFAQNVVVTFNGGTTGVTFNTVNAGGTQITATLSNSLLLFGGNFAIGITNPPPGGGPAGSELLFTVNAPAPPANDAFANATPVTSAIFSTTVDNFNATTETSDPVPGCAGNQSSNPRGKSVWWRYAAGPGGTVTVDTLGSAYDTIVDVVTGAPGAFSDVACSNDVSGSVPQSQVSFNAAAGATYYFMVTVFDVTKCSTNFAECGGKTVFHFSGPSPVGINAMPTSTTILAGTAASFSVSTLAPPLSGSVTFTIAGCPPVSTCTFSPASVTAGSSTTLTVATKAYSGVPRAPGVRVIRPIPTWWPCWVLALTILFLIWRLKSRTRRQTVVAWVQCAALLALMAGFTAGCKSGGVAAGGTPGTPPGAYPLTVTATGTGNTSATTTILLNVN